MASLKYVDRAGLVAECVATLPKQREFVCMYECTKHMFSFAYSKFLALIYLINIHTYGIINLYAGTKIL